MLLLLAQAAWAKGITVKIEVEGAALPQTLTITDPAIVEEFTIWSGPQSGRLRPDGSLQSNYSGAFIDFAHGPIDKPRNALLHFEVRFYIAGERGGELLGEPYEVRYAVDPAKPGGYMYLPDEGTSYIRHGVENNWFQSAPKWEALVRPAIETAISGTARQWGS